jgi:hypothetical protein
VGDLAAALAHRELPAGAHPNTDHSPRAYAHDFVDSIRYMLKTPLVLAIALAWVGGLPAAARRSCSSRCTANRCSTAAPRASASSGRRRASVWWRGGVLAHRIGKRLSFGAYKDTISGAFVVHGLTYVLFAIMPNIWLSALFVGISRIAMGTINVLNRTMLLTHVPDRYRGRVFSTAEMMMNTTMLLSLSLASVATDGRAIPSEASAWWREC